MASIRKRGKKWEVQVRKKGLPSITKSFTVKKSALLWSKTVESEIERGIYFDHTTAEQTTIKELAGQAFVMASYTEQSTHFENPIYHSPD